MSARISFSDMPCSIARALAVVGDGWTLLILREFFLGSQRFGEFEKALGIAPNILAQRLGRLVEDGLVRITDTARNGRAQAYVLTERGRDLFPVLVALMQWGDRHAVGPEGAFTRVIERTTGAEIAPVTVRAASGAPLGLNDVAIVPGPGAPEGLRRRIADQAGKVPPP
jgi:DNA-binding HxlR family transcriptional regulator